MAPDKPGTWQHRIVRALDAEGVHFMPYVPDGTLAPLVSLAEQDSSFTTHPVSREEEGVGIAAGVNLTGKRSALLLQVTGLGNSLNAIGSLALAQRIPLLLIVSERGGLAETVSTQLPLGRAMPRMLDALGVTHHALRPNDPVEAVVAAAVETAFISRTTVAVRLTPELSMEATS